MADAWRHSPFIARPHRRLWRDIKKWRLALGLIAAPILPIVLGSMLLWVVDSADRFTDDGEVISIGTRFINIVRVGATIEAVAGCWSLVAGFAALALRARRSGLVGRIDCFLLGIILAFSLPLVFWLGTLAVDAVLVHGGLGSAYFNLGDLGTEGLGIAALVGLPLTPFGLLGGWIFWRLVVRPANEPAPDVIGVFE